MTITSQDRNTALTIAIVLVVCTVSLVAVLSTLLQLLQPVFAGTGRLLGALSLQVQATNYNFVVKPKVAQTVNVGQTVSTATTSKSVTSASSSSTGVSRRRLTAAEAASIGKTVGIWKDVVSNNGKGYQPAMSLVIPKIGFSGTVFTGDDAAGALQRGLWAPAALELNKSNTLLCERSAFAPNRPNSCFFLTDLAIGDTITIAADDLAINYEIVGIGTHSKSAGIYIPTANASLKIVTNSPQNDSMRLVILAAPQSVGYVD